MIPHPAVTLAACGLWWLLLGAACWGAALGLTRGRP